MKGVYVILTKPVISHEDLARICVTMSVPMLQLREKHLPDREFIRIAFRLREITYGTQTKLVINDRPDIALLCEADYLHLGQDDMDIDDARRLVGDKIKIGLSTHNLLQAERALAKRPDYIAFGPIFSTNAKENPDPPTGTELLWQVVQMADVPVVAIGGIFPENIEQVLQTGVQCVAFIRHIAHSTNPEKSIRMIYEKFKKFGI